MIRFLLFLTLFQVNFPTTLSQNIDKSIREQCRFNNIVRYDVVVTRYNKPNKLKNVYNVHSLENKDNLNLFIDSYVCNYFVNNFKKIGFVNDDKEYFKIKKLIVSNDIYEESVNKCKELNSVSSLENDECVVKSRNDYTTTGVPVTTTTGVPVTTTTGVPVTTTTGLPVTTTTGLPVTTTTGVPVTTTTGVPVTTTTGVPVTTTTSSNSINQAKPQESKTPNNEVNNDAILGGVLGTLLCIGLIGMIIFIVKKRRNVENNNSPSGDYEMEGVENTLQDTEYLEPTPVSREPNAPLYNNINSPMILASFQELSPDE